VDQSFSSSPLHNQRSQRKPRILLRRRSSSKARPDRHRGNRCHPLLGVLEVVVGIVAGEDIASVEGLADSIVVDQEDHMPAEDIEVALRTEVVAGNSLGSTLC